MEIPQLVFATCETGSLLPSPQQLDRGKSGPSFRNTKQRCGYVVYECLECTSDCGTYECLWSLRVTVERTSDCGAYECLWSVRVSVERTSVCGAYE